MISPVAREDDVERPTWQRPAIDEIQWTDAVESLPWLLDVVFALAGRLRPYTTYLPWELREHAFAVPEWSADAFPPEVERILAGDPAAPGDLRVVRLRGHEDLGSGGRPGRNVGRGGNKDAERLVAPSERS